MALFPIRGGGEVFDPAPLADYHITGDPSPDCKGDYFEAGEYGGRPWYLQDDENFCIWWQDGSGKWFIAESVGGFGNHWSKAGPAITGDYNFVPPTSGTPTVAAGPG